MAYNVVREYLKFIDKNLSSTVENDLVRLASLEHNKDTVEMTALLYSLFLGQCPHLEYIHISICVCKSSNYKISKF